LAHQSLVAVGFRAAKTVVDVKQMQGIACRVKGLGQQHRIKTARNQDHDGAIGLAEELVKLGRNGPSKSW
jgi:hypothetical protein